MSKRLVNWILVKKKSNNNLIKIHNVNKNKKF